MSAYNNDDTYNVIAEHVIEALQADSKLGSGGALAIKNGSRNCARMPVIITRMNYRPSLSQ